MTYLEIIEVFKANNSVRPDYYTENSSDPTCKACGTSLDIYAKVVDSDRDPDFKWQMVKCLRCGQTTVIKFTGRS